MAETRTEREGWRETLLLKWRQEKGIKSKHEAVIVGGKGYRPYVNFYCHDGCGLVSLEPSELAIVVNALERVRRARVKRDG